MSQETTNQSKLEELDLKVYELFRDKFEQNTVFRAGESFRAGGPKPPQDKNGDLLRFSVSRVYTDFETVRYKAVLVERYAKDLNSSVEKLRKLVTENNLDVCYSPPPPYSNIETDEQGNKLFTFFFECDW